VIAHHPQQLTGNRERKRDKAPGEIVPGRGDYSTVDATLTC